MGHGGRDRRLLESVGRAGALGVLLVALVAWWLAWAGSSAAATIRYGDSRVAAAASMSGPVGPLVAYAFSEGSGTTTADASGNAVTGLVQDATWTAAGKAGNALAFDGATSYVELGRPAGFDWTGSMTWEAWVYVPTNPPDDGQIIALSDGVSGWQLKTSPDTGQRTFAVAVSADGASLTQRYSKTAIDLNTWYHVAAVYNATVQTLDLFVNGVVDDGTLTNPIGARSSVPAVQVLPPSDVNVNIGRRSGGYYFNGTIDDVRVYGRALSQAEIKADMNTPLPGPVATLAPARLDFGTQTVDVASVAQEVTVSNTGAAPLSTGGITITGTGAASYRQTTTCGAQLAPGETCTVHVTFAPVTAGTQTATLGLDGVTAATSLLGVGMSPGLVVTPGTATLTSTETQQFTASSPDVSWSVDGVVGGSAATGTISSSGVYTPPSGPGWHTVTAATAAPPQTGNAVAYTTNYRGTFTRDVNNMRTGLNDNETVLTPANVNSKQFGKLASYPIDGTADASPLYVPNVSIPGNGVHNVIFVATEHDSVYAFDAEGNQTSPLWQVSFINPSAGVTTVPPNDTGECCDIAPEIGITGTPVIDAATNTLYVVAKTKETADGIQYVHRLHALDLGTGAEKFGGPVVIQASVLGTGLDASGGQVAFDSLRENQRPALLLANNVVYVAFGAHGDQPPYHGWVLGYDATSLTPVMALCTSPDDAGNGVWQSGDGVATDASANLYFVTGNGPFDADTGGTAYGDSLLKISPTGTVLDYFTPHDQQYMSDNDIDLGSGGVLLLPDQPGPHPHLAITAGKNGTIYLVDRDNLGRYNPSDDSQIVQSVVNIFPHGNFTTGNFKAPVYWNGNLYFSADADVIKSFSITNGLLSTSPTSQTSTVMNYPGATLSVSSNGNTNGILWALQRIDFDPTGAGVQGPGILHAYDANNLDTELYNSDQVASRDGLDFTAKWSSPTVANGRVYVASLSQLTIYGLLPQAEPAPPQQQVSADLKFVPVDPVRVLDTRDGTGGVAVGKVAAGGTVSFPVVGGQVPPEARAVALNVTTTAVDGPGYATVWPHGEAMPTTSSVNVSDAGETAANAAVVPVGQAGMLDMATFEGAHLVADLTGYWIPAGSTVDGRLHSVATPTRLLDTRDGTGAKPGGVFAAGEQFDLQVTGTAVPAGATAAVVTVTYTGATAPGYLTVWPTGGARPTVSTTNPNGPGDIRSNLAIVKIGIGGRVSVFSYQRCDVVIDVVGYFADDTTGHGLFTPMSPHRVEDSRLAGQPFGRIGGGQTASLPYGALVPAAATTVIYNLTATQTTSGGFLTTYAAGQPRPLASSVNWSGPDQNRAAFNGSALGADRAVDHFAYSDTDVIVDLAGWFN